jgi:YHS domain-containing protein
MNDLSRLDQHIREKMATFAERSQVHQQHVRQRMDQINQLYQKFTQVADHVAEHLIRPRMELLASYFENAEALVEVEQTHRHHCRYRFQHTQRFPATVTLDVAVCPDAQVTSILVIYNLEILPIFFHFEGKDQIGFPLDSVDEPRLVAWIEQKIKDFLDTYLRLEETDQYQRENTVRDPVCGMQISKAWAAAQIDYRGQTYYFCVEECRAKFAENPQLYVNLVTPGTGGIGGG